MTLIDKAEALAILAPAPNAKDGLWAKRKQALYNQVAALPARGVRVPEAMRQMIVQAVRFANLAAGEGICIDDLEPETFLFDYSQATGNEDWDTLPARILAARAADAERIRGLEAERDELRGTKETLSGHIRYRYELTQKDQARIAALTAQVEKLRGAIEAVLFTAHADDHVGWQMALEEARAALTEEPK